MMCRNLAGSFTVTGKLSKLSLMNVLRNSCDLPASRTAGKCVVNDVIRSDAKKQLITTDNKEASTSAVNYDTNQLPPVCIVSLLVSCTV